MRADTNDGAEKRGLVFLNILDFELVELIELIELIELDSWATELADRFFVSPF